MRNTFWMRARRPLVLALSIHGLIAGTAQAEEPAAREEAKEEAAAPAIGAGPAFDRAFSATSPDGPGEVGVAGKVVHRFTPPVAAPIDSKSPGQPLAQTTGPVLRPCDTPGSGCRNPQPISSQVGVPPIVPGTRPPRGNP